MAETCSVCGGSFGSAADLVVHARDAHSDGAPASAGGIPSQHRYACALCGARFAHPEQLRDHNLTPHPLPGRIGRPSPRPGRPRPA